MTDEEKTIIHNEARKILCKTHRLSIPIDYAVTLALQQILKIVDALAEKSKDDTIIPATMSMEGSADDINNAYVCVVFDNKDEFKKTMLERFKNKDKVLVKIWKKEAEE